MSKLAALIVATGVLMVCPPAYAETLKVAAPAAGAVPRIAPNAVEFTLDNGLQVVVIPDRRAPVVTHMLWYRVGSADETAGQSGLAHFFEHLMFKGTEANPAGRFSARVSQIGGEENAFTTTDYTAYFQRVAKENLAEMMALEADRMTGLVLTDAVVAPERNVVIEERRQRVENDPAALLNEAMTAILYNNHPYGRPVIGWMHEIEALDSRRALDFYRRYYTPNNAVLVVAGDVAPEEVRSLAQATYGKLPARPDAVRAARPAEPTPVGPRTITVRDDKVRERQLTRAYSVPSRATAEGREAEALTVLAEILGGGATSRLYDRLVRGDGPATYSGAYYQPAAVDDSRFVVYGVPKEGVELRDLDGRIEAVIADLLRDGVAADELERAKNSAVAQAVYAQDSQQSLARIVGTALMTGSSLADIQDWPARVKAVTAAEVRAAARKYLVEDRSVTGYLEQKRAERS